MNKNINVGAIATISILSAFLFIKHSSFSALIPFRLAPKAAAEPAEYQPVGRLVLDGDYELDEGWLLHTDKANGCVTEITISKNGKPVYKEKIENNDSVRPIGLPGTAGSGYVKDLDGDGQKDFLLENVATDSSRSHGQKYTYTMFSLGDAISRTPSQSFDEAVQIRDLNTDGVYEEICKDTTLIDFANQKHSGPSEEIVLSWDGTSWSFNASLMQHKPLPEAALDQLAREVESKMIRYDSTLPDGTSVKRIELHPQAWAPLAQLIYQGNAKQAHKVLDKVWAANETAMLDQATTAISKEEFWKQLLDAISHSAWGSDVMVMNRLPS